jgi:hypothetical protein
MSNESSGVTVSIAVLSKAIDQSKMLRTQTVSLDIKDAQEIYEQLWRLSQLEE